jgi:2-keto-4-pentenoate hydratase/2-oxohepta-3-ene-1,7-dioic acid hydratase in catechol pathway
MRLLNNAGRLALQFGGGALDVERASGGRFGSDPQAVYSRWDEFRSWAVAVDAGDAALDPVRESTLGPPVPGPAQVFAVGLNYREHAAEAGLELPDDAWDHVAGLTVGQDLSDRGQQLSGPAPQQYNLGKSFAGFTPIGPALVTPEDFDDPDDLELSCALPDGQMQKTRTSDLIFPIAAIVKFLSNILPLLPGDLIFTGTPSGIGWTRDPRRTLRADDELVTEVVGIGQMRHTFRTR